MTRILLYGERGRFPNYERALTQAGAALGWSGTGEDLERFDGLLLPGGGDIAPWRLGEAEGLAKGIDEVRDAIEWRLTEQFLEMGRPILGICRGVQMLNVVLGGTLYQHIDGHQAVDGVDGRHNTTARADSRVACLYGLTPTVNSAHHQALKQLGEELIVTQWAEDGTVEAVEHTRLPVWGVQWHPERLIYPDGQKIYRLFVAEAAACRSSGDKKILEKMEKPS